MAKKVWQSYDKVYLAGKVDTKSTSLNCAKRLWPNDNFSRMKINTAMVNTNALYLTME